MTAFLRRVVPSVTLRLWLELDFGVTLVWYDSFIMYLTFRASVFCSRMHPQQMPNSTSRNKNVVILATQLHTSQDSHI
jgi:hypothetical protein